MKKKIFIYIITFIVFILFISIGYNILSANKSVDISTSVIKSSWNIAITKCNIDKDKSFGDFTSPTISSDNSSINYNINLKSNEYIYVSLIIENNGSMDAILGSNPFISGIEDISNIIYSIKYNNGDKVKKNDLLKSGESKNINILIKNNSNIDLDNLNFDVGFNYYRTK